MKLSHVIIAGAGPGGLTAALALARRGIRYTIVEKVERDLLLSDVGGAYDISPNTLALLDALGPGAELRAAAERFAEVLTLGRDGRRIGQMRIPPAIDFCSALRSTLQRVLLRELDDDVLCCEAEIERFHANDDSVTVYLSGGKTLKGDVLLGADGIYSTVRQGMLADGQPHFCNCMCWWGRAPVEKISAEAFRRGRAVFMGGGGGAFAGGVCEGEMVWSLFFPAQRYERIEDPAERKRDLLQRIEHGWADFLSELIEVSEPERIAQVGIWDRDPVPHWTAGRVALLGDAAHPMTPFLGQGCNNAVIDGFVLADALATHDDVPSAFARYEERRMKGVDKNVRTARLLCSMMVGSGWWSKLTYRAMFGWMPESLMVKSLTTTDQINDVSDLLPAEG
jgi:salicylate hydroxylase